MSIKIRNIFWLTFVTLTFLSCDVMDVNDANQNMDEGEEENLTITEPEFDVVELNQFGLYEAKDINNQGDIIGGTHYLNSSTRVLLDIGFAGTSLNDNGQITGESNGAAYFWENKNGKTRISHPYHYLDVIEEWITPFDINNSGRVVGEAWIVDLIQFDDSDEPAYIDTEEAIQWIDGESAYSMIEQYARANGINDNDMIVGTHSSGAFKWDPSSYRTILLDSEGSFEEAHAINNNGQIVGSVMWADQNNLMAGGATSEESSSFRSKIMKVQRITELHGVYDTCHLLRILQSSGISAKSTVRIESEAFDFQQMYNEKILPVWGKKQQQEMINSVLNGSYSSKAFIWDENNGDQELGTLGGDWSTAFDINDNGQVVGYSDIGNGEYRAFYWDQENGMVELPSGGKNSIARAINNHGQIVGYNDGPVMWELKMGN